MLPNDLRVIEQALAWHDQGQRCVLVTVLRTFGASPRPPGAMAVIDADGRIVGSVSGGCVEDDLVHEVRSGALWPAGPGVLQRVYGRDAAERERYRLPCGNALHLAIEPAWDATVLRAALARMQARQTVRRVVHVASGRSHLEHGPQGPVFADDAQGFATVLGPGLRLLLIGANEVSACLLPIAQSLGYAVTVCDPRTEYTATWHAPGVPLLSCMPDDAVLAFACDERTAVITLTHDPKLDDLALMEALRSPAFHVGALGSRMTTARRVQRLRLFDLSEAQLARLKGPVGLPIGSRSPAEIAVSVAAELVQLRSWADAGAEPQDWRQQRPSWMPPRTALAAP